MYWNNFFDVVCYNVFKVLLILFENDVNVNMCVISIVSFFYIVGLKYMIGLNFFILVGCWVVG